jgi:O-antigen/teichoic acid export membrane protein
MCAAKSGPDEPSHDGDVKLPFRVLSRRRVLNGFIASYANFILSATTSLIATPVLVHLLGSEDYGLWLTVSSILTYLSLSGAGFPQATQNRMAEEYAKGNDEKAIQYLSTSVWCTVVLVVFSSGLGYVLLRTGVVSTRLFRGSVSLSQIALPVLIIAGVGYLVSLPLQQYRGALRAMQHVGVAEGISAGSNVVAVGIGISAVVLGSGVVGFAVSQALVLVGTGLVMMVMASMEAGRRVRTGIWHFNVSRAKELVPASFHFLVISLAGALIWSTDNLVISFRLGASKVTPYAVSFRIFTMATSAISAVTISLLPSVAVLSATGEKARLRAASVQTARLVMVGTFLVSVELMLFGRSFLMLWAGAAVVAPLGTIVVFCLIFIVCSFAQAFELIVVGMSRQGPYAAIIIVEGVVNLVLTLLLVGPLGVTGVALGTLCAQLTGSGWFLPWYASRCLDLSIGRMLRQAVLPVLPATVVAIGAGVAATIVIGAGSWSRLVISIATVGAAFCIVFAFVSSNEWERNLTVRCRGRLGQHLWSR